MITTIQTTTQALHGCTGLPVRVSAFASRPAQAGSLGARRCALDHRGESKVWGFEAPPPRPVAWAQRGHHALQKYGAA